MNKIHILNTLHKAFLNLKNASTFMLISAVIVIFSMQSNIAFGESVVPHVETKIVASIDGKERAFTATQNTVEGALAQGGIVLNEYDVTTPERTSLLRGGEVKVNVIRALPVLVSDNGQERLAFSAFNNASEIASQLKIAVYQEDKISTALILDPVDERAAGQKLIIERAPVYAVEVDGGEQEIRSWGTTVASILQDKIPLGAKDIVDPPLAAGVMGGVKITITRVNEAEVESTETIPLKTNYVNDYSMYKGQEKVTQEGSEGQKKMIYKITYHNGVETDRVVLSSETLSESVTRIISRGVKPYNAGMWWDALVTAGRRWGVEPADLYSVMLCESGGNPYNSNGTNIGLFQYLPSTWTTASSNYPGGTYRGASITDGNAQIEVTAWKVSQQSVRWTGWGCKP